MYVRLFVLEQNEIRRAEMPDSKEAPEVSLGAKWCVISKYNHRARILRMPRLERVA